MSRLKVICMYLMLPGMLLCMTSCAGTQSPATAPTTEKVTLAEGMVAAAHPLAAQAGADVLKEGGNAIDAAVATAFTLNVVEPHASGIGGGGFMMIYLADTNEVHVIDYRETAPAALTEDLYTDGDDYKSSLMRYGGTAVATPGMTRGLLHAHGKFGSMGRDRLLQPAITFASEGFPASADISGQVESNLDKIMESETASSIFLQDGVFPITEGTTVLQSGLGTVLQNIARDGESAVYNPEMAEAIASEVRKQGGVMTVEDIMGYQPMEREPVAASYRGYDIVTIGPPSSGGLTVLQTLSILDQFDLSEFTAESPEYLALLAKALEAAQISTDKYVADPAFTDVPIDDLLGEEWYTQTALQIGKNLSMAEGLSEALEGATQIPTTSEHPGNTTHLSVVDQHGNMVALTQTINYFFGSGVVIPEHGIFMNNEMADFSYERGSVNVPAPGKRPRSSISPVLVMKDGRPIAAIGSPGGRRIPAALVQIIVRCIDFNQPLQEAIDGPRLFVDAERTRLAYEPRYPENTIDRLSQILSREKEWDFEKKGEMDKYFGGAQGIWIRDTDAGPTLEGAADPRRGGAVAGTGPSVD